MIAIAAYLSVNWVRIRKLCGTRLVLLSSPSLALPQLALPAATSIGLFQSHEAEQRYRHRVLASHRQYPSHLIYTCVCIMCIIVAYNNRETDGQCEGLKTSDGDEE